ncbi:ATP-dependent RNA helicase ddx23 isoform X2 [Eurosta solidaginis]|uniref:ATP-dependent RNA helicase ddx23 isoform X2 n=1 Tax=Eurosta solidaginis TaxID=178769 RepID=UPI003530E8C7
MKQFKLLIWLALFLQEDWLPLCTALQQQTSPKTQSSIVQLYDSNREATPASESLLGSIYRKSRQSRCVRCYEDRYGDDRSRYYGAGWGATAGIGAGGSGYSNRIAENWYYPHERYEDRYRPDDRYRGDERYGSSERHSSPERYRPEHDRYSPEYAAAPSYNRDRDDRLGQRTYDRYEVRGYDRYDRRGGAYGQDSYADYYRDRNYERPRGGGSGGYDRDYYDRSTSSRYDYRNYRPWDETYRGQSGFDNSGRGYYFADEDNDRRRYLPKPAYDQRYAIPRCGMHVTDCPYAGDAGGGDDTTRVTSGPINSQHGYNFGAGYGYGVGSSGGNSGSSGGSATTYNTSANNASNTNNSNNGQGWSYANERDRESSLMQGANSVNGDRGRGRERERGREQQRLLLLSPLTALRTVAERHAH